MKIKEYFENNYDCEKYTSPSHYLWVIVVEFEDDNL